MIERRENLKSSWSQEGHASQRQAELVMTIADPVTSPQIRRLCYTSLLRNKTDPDHPQPHSKGSKRNPEGGADSSTAAKFICFPAFPIKVNVVSVMQALKKLNIRLNISQIMPHINLPIGTKQQATLSTMTDTCAGLNSGRLAYHKHIAEKQPHLVESFVYLKDVEGMDEFDIGGVDDQGKPARVTAVITYQTPFRVHGQPVCISFGLADSASTNTILGLPFLRATRSAIFLDGDGEESIVCQRLGTTFPLRYQVPLRADRSPDTGGKDVRGAFLATPNPSLQQLNLVREEVHAQFKALNVDDGPGPLVPGFHIMSENKWSVVSQE